MKVKNEIGVKDINLRIEEMEVMREIEDSVWISFSNIATADDSK